ncbi:MAG: hypothetical protein KIS96_11370 [Bauldia sp.]|nr:hypothetical protein [Bauldia sp.]
MNKRAEAKTATAEIVDEADILPAPISADEVDASLAVGLTRAEIDTQIATARRFPRELTDVRNRLLTYVTLDEETAEECMYALPRGGKPIKGPSIRFAEALKASFGNCRVAARIVHVDRVEKVVIAEGIFHDLETNAASKAEVRRRIVDKHNRLFSNDMIIVTGNAACSIALRNAILSGVPKPVWRKAYDAVQRVIAGDQITLSENREKAVSAFARFGVSPAQVFESLGLASEIDIALDHIPVLRGMYAALKNGESTVEEMFAPAVKAGPGHATVANPLSDETIDPETGEVQSGAQRGAVAETNAAPVKGDEPTASAKAASGDAGGAAPGSAVTDRPPQASPASDAPAGGAGDSTANPQTDERLALGAAQAAVVTETVAVAQETAPPPPNSDAAESSPAAGDAALPSAASPGPAGRSSAPAGLSSSEESVVRVLHKALAGMDDVASIRAAAEATLKQHGATSISPLFKAIAFAVERHVKRADGEKKWTVEAVEDAVEGMLMRATKQVDDMFAGDR